MTDEFQECPGCSAGTPNSGRHKIWHDKMSDDFEALERKVKELTAAHNQLVMQLHKNDVLKLSPADEAAQS